MQLPLSSSLVVMLAFAASACGSAKPKPEDPALLTAGGIGAMVRLDGPTGAVAVDKVAVGGGAKAAGVAQHEIIWEIDGASVIGQPFDNSVMALRGRVGSQVRLKVGRTEADAREVTVTRGAPPGQADVCQAGDCKNGTGTSIDMWGDRYDGEFKDGFYNGLGKIVEPSGRSYEGGFVDGAASGKGIATSDSGVRFEGTFDHGYPAGEVKITRPNGDVYLGESKDFTMHGQGKVTRPSNGDTWEGTFEYDVQTQGTWTHFPEGGDGRSCTRLVKDGQLVQNGAINYAPGDKKKRVTFDGPFGDDCVANGEGRMTYEKNRKYVGPFIKDEQGKGVKVLK